MKREDNLSKSLSRYLQKFHRSSFHFHASLAFSSYKVANFLENSRTLSDYLTSTLDSVHNSFKSFIGEEFTMIFKCPHKKSPRDLKQGIEGAMQMVHHIHHSSIRKFFCVKTLYS